MAVAMASFNPLTSTIVNKRSWSHLELKYRVERIWSRSLHRYFSEGFTRNSDVDCNSGDSGGSTLVCGFSLAYDFNYDAVINLKMLDLK